MTIANDVSYIKIITAQFNQVGPTFEYFYRPTVKHTHNYRYTIDIDAFILT